MLLSKSLDLPQPTPFKLNYLDPPLFMFVLQSLENFEISPNFDKCFFSQIS